VTTEVDADLSVDADVSYAPDASLPAVEFFAMASWEGPEIDLEEQSSKLLALL
jgi:hypothetical protein